MQSSNPIFNRAEGFSQPQYGHQQYADPSTWGTGVPGEQMGYAPAQPTSRMTIDSVVQKTGLTLFVALVAAALTWFLTPEIATVADQQVVLGNVNTIYGLAIVGSGLAFVLSLVNSFKRVISPALVLAFAAAEGVALGGISKVFEAVVYPGIVMQAVLGTFAAFAGTLAAYKFLNIKVGSKFRTFVVAAMFGMVALGMLEMVIRLFGGGGMGIFGNGALGALFALAGLVLGVFMLILDFDFVEQGIANGLDERESWRAAFGFTVDLVWIYTNLLKLLAIFNND